MNKEKFNTLVQNIKKLRHPENGCPWDLEQDHQSLKKYLIEECYEAVEAIENNNYQEMVDELGDILLQVILHSTIGEENKSFELDDVINNLNEKVVRRHPHVFSGEKVDNSEEVSRNWEKIKNKEKSKKPFHLENKITQMPSLQSSYKIGKKTEKIKFDWRNPFEVLEKVQEEFSELEVELKNNSPHIEEEFGDLIFTVAQLGRHLKLNPEESLRKSNKKFIRRYNKMLDLLEESKLSPESTSTTEMNKYWNLVKSEETKI